MKIFSTFSGMGGFEIGIQNAYRSSVGYKSKRYAESPMKQVRDYSPRRAKYSCREQTVWWTPFKPSLTKDHYVGFSEIDKYAIKVYERHFNGTQTMATSQKSTQKNTRLRLPRWRIPYKHFLSQREAQRIWRYKRDTLLWPCANIASKTT